MTGNMRQTAPELTWGTLRVTCDNSPTCDGTGPQKAPEGTGDMKSIDKLREWANGLHGVYINQVDHTITVTTGWDAPPDMDSVSLRDHVNGILDGIEREVAELRDREYRNGREDAKGAVEFADRLKAAVDNREDVTLFGVDYTALPVDADGEPIHAGDMLDGYGKTIEVVEMRYGRSGWVLISRDGNGYADCAAFTHHHAPTVEDVLEELLREYDRDDSELTNGEIIERFAARLQLKEG